MIRRTFRENPTMIRDLVIAMLVYGVLVYGLPPGLFIAYLDAGAINQAFVSSLPFYLPAFAALGVMAGLGEWTRDEMARPRQPKPMQMDTASRRRDRQGVR